MALLDEIHPRIDCANVMPGQVPLGDVEWAMVDAWRRLSGNGAHRRA